ncbi:hypothetical protein ACIOD1_31410 [Streptomyces sp. NPDC088097]|uniref:D-alanyl-D-alanine carboxypeptidase n=1 Tax=Streptomyces sp. NPDC088097 TaxID=3365823 RepID=UPI00380069BA
MFRTVKPAPAPEGAGKAVSAPAGPRTPSEPSKPAQGASDAAEPSSASGDADKPATKPADKPATEPADGGSERTAVFRTVRPAPVDADRKAGSGDAEKPSGDAPKSGSASATAGEPPAKPADKPADGDSERTAVFRAVKPAPADADRKTAFGVVKPAPAAGDTAEGDSASTRSRTGSEPAKPARADGDAPKSSSASDPRSGKPADGPADGDSERTAVFRAVKPAPADADRKPASGATKPATTGADAPKPGSASADADKPADKPAAKPADKAAEADSERTAVFRAVKPAGTAPAPAPDAKKPEPRSSTFVPLGGDTKPRTEPKPRPTPAPVRAPAPGSAPQTTVPRLDPSERTSQQPLPPRPPLDMLADLTNNPPPPPSPLRTTVRRFKIYAPIVLLLAIVLAVVQLVRPLPAPKLVLTAQSSYAFPGGKPDLPWPTEGQASMAAAGLGTIGSSGEQKPVPIASVTKSMTAYIILRDHPFKMGDKGAVIDIDKTAEIEGQKDKSDNESTLNTVKEGNKISEYDAIAALMIPSANNIARLLARWDAGSQEAFVKKMNDTAKELGMTNTTYTDPSGLDATTVSTAEDQVKLGLKIVEIEALVDITRKPSWVDPSGKNWPNWNRLVPYNDSLGIKTGTTTKAGGNLLFAAQKKVGDTNQLIVGAVLGQHKPPIIDSVIAASRTLLIGTQKSIEGATVVKKGQVVGYVDDGLGGRTPVVATADVQAVGWSSLTVDIKLGPGSAAVPGSAPAGAEVGVLTVGDGASQVKVPVALKGALDTPGVSAKLTRIG